MEQSILENSKGATYMSFILDIEIVIKKDGARANLAETKAKSQVSKKEGQSKEPFAASRNQDVKVYAVSAPARKSIFELPLGNDQESDTSKSNKGTTSTNMNPSLISNKENISETLISNKENVPENQNFQEKTDTLGVVEKPSVSDKQENVAANNVKPKKRKISKAEKKAKVFKGKIEPIDFLECNRIFMCNYLRLPFYRNKRKFDIDNRSSDSKVISSDENSSKSICAEQRSLSVQKLDKQTFKTLRRHKFTKMNSSNLVNKDSKPDICASGDCDTIVNTSYVDSNEFEIRKLNKIDSGDRKFPKSKKQIKRKHFVSELKCSECKTNTLTRNIAISDNGENQNISTEYSHIPKEQDKKSTVLRKCKSTSIPRIEENIKSKIANSTKSDINQHYKTCNKKSFSFIRALYRKRNEKTFTDKEGLSGLQISCFDDGNLFAPQLNIENESTQIVSNCTGESMYMKKEETLHDMARRKHEICEISDKTHNINCTIKEKGFSETNIKPTKCSSALKDQVVSSNNINKSVLKKCNINGKYDTITAGNTEKSQSMTNVLPTSLDSKPDSCIITPQINTLSPASEENYLDGNQCELGENSYEDNLEIEELKADLSNEKCFKAVPIFSYEDSLSEMLVEKCDVDIYQTAIEKQISEKTETGEKQFKKPKTTTLKALYSYMKTVTTKLRK